MSILKCYFVSDLHGSFTRYKTLFSEIIFERPDFVFIGGDIFSSKHKIIDNFVKDFLYLELENLKSILGDDYPEIYIILGNDDPKSEEKLIIELEEKNYLFYIHNKYREYGEYKIYGYSNVSPTPFRFKDWEKYDITFDIDSRCFPLESGIRTFEISLEEIRTSTLQNDLIRLFGDSINEKTIVLFHAPPYNTGLDCLWNGEHAGSKAIREFIEIKQPYITLHGHIHESAEVSGKWKQKIGKTFSFNASFSGSELSIIKFDLEDPSNAIRILK